MSFLISYSVAADAFYTITRIKSLVSAMKLVLTSKIYQLDFFLAAKTLRETNGNQARVV